MVGRSVLGYLCCLRPRGTRCKSATATRFAQLAGNDDLRHTFATLLGEHGPEHDVTLKDVSAALGHSSTKITADLYTHVTTGMKRRVARAAEAIMRASREQS
jgi:integrase